MNVPVETEAMFLLLLLFLVSRACELIRVAASVPRLRGGYPRNHGTAKRTARHQLIAT